MGHLKKAASGHLLKTTGGHLVNECAAAENTCNSCDPAIPDTLYATFSGLAGDFASLNGKQTLLWIAGCEWGNFVPRPDEGAAHTCQLLFISGSTWQAWINPTAGNCNKHWRGGTSNCEPEGAYAEYSCTDSGCNDTDSCEDSAGASCVVSLT